MLLQGIRMGQDPNNGCKENTLAWPNKNGNSQSLYSCLQTLKEEDQPTGG